MFEIEKVIEVSIKDLKEWEDNPIIRKNIPDDSLRKSLDENGLTGDTIAVVPNGNGYIVVDGNRRLRIAKELVGTSGKFLAKVYSKDVDKIELALTLNGVGKPWDRQTYVQFVVNHPERIEYLPKQYRKSTKRMYDLLEDDFEWFSANCKPNAFDWGVQLANYVGRGDDKKFVKRTVLWVGRYKLVREVRRALDSNYSKSKTEKAILDNKPLRLELTVAE